jgi:hypothetical protein
VVDVRGRFDGSFPSPAVTQAACAALVRAEHAGRTSEIRCPASKMPRRWADSGQLAPRGSSDHKGTGEGSLRTVVCRPAYNKELDNLRLHIFTRRPPVICLSRTPQSSTTRPRSTIRKRPLISSGLVGSRLSQPNSTHLSKLIVVSHQEQLWSLQNGIQEMISIQKLPLELSNRIYGWVYRPQKAFLYTGKMRKNSVDSGPSHNHKIDITHGRFRLPCCGAVHERHQPWRKTHTTQNC